MILVDSSVWIDHFHKVDRELVGLLERAEVIAHPMVIEELAMGSLRDRPTVLEALGDLRGGAVLSHHELLTFVGARSLWGKGLSPIDAHLLGTALLGDRTHQVWTRDKSLREAADALGIGYPMG